MTADRTRARVRRGGGAGRRGARAGTTGAARQAPSEPCLPRPPLPPAAQAPHATAPDGRVPPNAGIVACGAAGPRSTGAGRTGGPGGSPSSWTHTPGRGSPVRTRACASDGPPGPRPGPRVRRGGPASPPSAGRGREGGDARTGGGPTGVVVRCSAARPPLRLWRPHPAHARGAGAGVHERRAPEHDRRGPGSEPLTEDSAAADFVPDRPSPGPDSDLGRWTLTRAHGPNTPPRPPAARPEDAAR